MILKRKAILIGTILVFVIVLGASPLMALARGNTLTVGSASGAQYSSFKDAIAQAQDGDTIEIVSDIHEEGSASIDKQLTVLSRQNVTLDLTQALTIQPNGHLTLGSGASDTNLTSNIYVKNYGVLVVRDGLISTNRIDNYDGSTYQGEGGTFTFAVNIEVGASVAGKITGGNYIADDGDVFGVYGSYDEISGGTFKSASGNRKRSTVYIQGTLNKISGGDFISTTRSAMNVQHGGHILEITGGNFTGAENGIAIYAGSGNKSRIDKISGGDFNAKLGVWLAGNGDVSIGEITGGTFTGKSSGLQTEGGTKVEKIAGGTFKSNANGVLNVGTIKAIEGGNFDGGFYAIQNYTNGTIEVINGGIFKGEFSGIYNKARGTIQTINSGVFYGKYDYAYENASDNETRIEPELSGGIGGGRYWGGRDAIKGEVVYPDGFHMSSREATLPVDGFENNSFRYLKKAYTLSYDANGGAGEAPQAQVETNDKDVFSAKENPFTFIGKKFTGWNTAADGSGTAYQPGDEISLSIPAEDGSAPLGDTTLYAQWADLYSIVYDIDGANEAAPVDSNEYQQGDIVTVSDLTPTKEGYVFKAWGIGAQEFQPGASFTLDEEMIAQATDSKLTLTAVWEEAPAEVPAEPDNSSNTEVPAEPDNSNNTDTPAVNTDSSVEVKPAGPLVPKTGEDFGAMAGMLTSLFSGSVAMGMGAYRKAKKK